MKAYLFIIGIIIFFASSCSKDDPAPDLSYLCSSGNIWLVDRIDTFHPKNSLDSFFFHQAGGFHKFIFINSGVNELSIEILAKPDSGETYIYGKQFIRSISGKYINESFEFKNTVDSVLSITNNGDHYLLSLDSSAIDFSTRVGELRFCNLRMTDVEP